MYSKAYTIMAQKHEFYDGYNKGMYHYIKSEYTEAAVEFGNVADKYDTCFGEHEISDLWFCYYYAESLYTINEYTEAMIYIDKALENCELHENTYSWVYYNLNKMKGVTYYKLDNLEGAKSFFLDLVDKEEEINSLDKDIILVAKWFLAYTHFYLDEYDKSIEISNSILNMEIKEKGVYYNEIVSSIEELLIIATSSDQNNNDSEGSVDY